MNRLFVDPDGLPTLDETYCRFTRAQVDFADVRYTRKKQVMEELFAGELDSLAREAGRLAADSLNFTNLRAMSGSKWSPVFGWSRPRSAL